MCDVLFCTHATRAVDRLPPALLKRTTASKTLWKKNGSGDAKHDKSRDANLCHHFNGCRFAWPVGLVVWRANVSTPTPISAALLLTGQMRTNFVPHVVALLGVELPMKKPTVPPSLVQLKLHTCCGERAKIAETTKRRTRRLSIKSWSK